MSRLKIFERAGTRRTPRWVTGYNVFARESSRNELFRIAPIFTGQLSLLYDSLRLKPHLSAGGFAITEIKKHFRNQEQQTTNKHLHVFINGICSLASLGTRPVDGWIVYNGLHVVC